MDTNDVPLEDGLLKEAEQDMYNDLKKNVYHEMQKRMVRLTGNTVERLTRDMEDQDLRTHTIDVLCLVKLASLLNTWQQWGVMNKAEHDELYTFLLRMSERAGVRRDL